MLLRLRDRTIDCTRHTAVMGILNVSDDSPVEHSRVEASRAFDRGMSLVRDGAEIVDVGANSTLTGSRDLPVEEEIARVCPVIERLAAEGVATSVDTWRPEVARAAAGAGVHVLNDVTGFTDGAMADVAAEFGLAAVVMHMRGEPKRHREADQIYDDIAAEVRAFLVERGEALRGRGVEAWLDPGFEFGKSLEDNVRLYHGLRDLVATGYPVLVSASRKGFLAQLIGRERDQRAPGIGEATLAFNVLVAASGVHVVRVHDVREVATALRVVDALRERREDEDAATGASRSFLASESRISL